MYGRVTRTFPDKGYGFILGENRQSYFIHYSNLNGEYIDPGYYVFFKPFQNERSDYNAKDIIVISTPEKKVKTEIPRKKKKYKSHKPCNADKVIVADKKFKKFVKIFLEEQKEKNIQKEKHDNGNTCKKHE